jgi:hypothetical protein
VRVPDLIFTDPMGRVIGLGEPLRHPLFGAEDAAPHFVAWRHAAPAGEVWAVLGDGGACRVAAWGRAAGPIAPVSRKPATGIPSPAVPITSTASVGSSAPPGPPVPLFV